MAVFHAMFCSVSNRRERFKMSHHLGPLGLPEVNSLTSCQGCFCPWVRFGFLTHSSGLQLGLASLEAMWPPYLAPLLSLESTRITSASSDGPEQISHFFLFQMCTVWLLPLHPWELWPCSAVRGAIMVLSALVLVFQLGCSSPAQHPWGFQSSWCDYKTLSFCFKFLPSNSGRCHGWGGFGKLVHSILFNRYMGESQECTLESFCVQKVGQPSIDLTCTRWRTETPSHGVNEAEQERIWVLYLIPPYHVDDKNQLLYHGLIQYSPDSCKYPCPV